MDAPEVSLGDSSDRRRALEQSRYFGLDDPLAIVTAGKEGASFVRRQLADRPFTLAFANALGRSKKPRIYAIVTTNPWTTCCGSAESAMSLWRKSGVS